jgi:hypothetical protein
VDTAKKMPVDDDNRHIVGDLENAIHSRRPTRAVYLYFVALGEMTLISRGHPIVAYPTYGFYWCGECDPKGRGARLKVLHIDRPRASLGDVDAEARGCC